MKNTIKKIAAATLSIALLAGCSASSAASTSSSSDKVIKVGATSVPHAQILNDVVKDVLKDAGWTLEVTEFTDYVTPNTALEEGSLDANYFQTLGYMNDQNTTNGLHLAAAVGVHIEPMGIYSSKLKAVTELKDGDVIGVPNDADNLDRALRLLVQKGILNDPSSTSYVTETTFNGNASLNPHNYKITPVEAAQVARSLDDFAVAVVNGNYALEASLPSTHPALQIEEFTEKTKIARTNFVVVKQDNISSEKTQALVKAITSEKVKKYIEDTYKGSVITSFIDKDGKAVN